MTMVVSCSSPDNNDGRIDGICNQVRQSLTNRQGSYQTNRNVVKLQTTCNFHDARFREETHVSNIVLCVDDQVRGVTPEPFEPSAGLKRRGRSAGCVAVTRP